MITPEELLDDERRDYPDAAMVVSVSWPHAVIVEYVTTSTHGPVGGKHLRQWRLAARGIGQHGGFSTIVHSEWV